MERLSKNPDPTRQENYVNALFQALQVQQNQERAKAMAAYMKNKFPFLGLNSPLRKEIQKAYFKHNALPAFEHLPKVVSLMYQNPYREMHYAAIDLCSKYVRASGQELIPLAEQMIAQHSWWDSVDGINSCIIRPIFKKNDEARSFYSEKWIASDNLWFKRSAIIAQLGFRDKTDPDLLSRMILKQHRTKEFFLNKAIGWALRDYAYTHPEWVILFVKNNELHPLSKREALKRLV